MKTNICEVCGTEYVMYKYNDYGGIAGVRTKYCSDKCSHDAKVAREKTYKRKKRGGSPDTKQKPGPKRQQSAKGLAIILRVGPLENQSCFGCPFLGWKCREMTYPPCRPHNKQHYRYKEVVRTLEDMFYWS